MKFLVIIILLLLYMSSSTRRTWIEIETDAASKTMASVVLHTEDVD